MHNKLTKSILVAFCGGLIAGLFVITVRAYLQKNITPNVSDWPQHQNDSVNGSWCGAAG
ncbi:MAG: hypothetical protein K8R89_06235 [Anaerolineae bacterium]|nr:hypothetical protein [Anaerolineae bacterium]